MDQVFVDIIKEEWRLLAGLIGAAGVATVLELAGKMPPWAWIALAAAVVVLLAVDLVIALWAPADPIMRDSIALSAVELAQLTSPDFPMPRRDRYTIGDNINVLREPLEKLPTQYREERRYASVGELSEYHLTLRFNRVA